MQSNFDQMIWVILSFVAGYLAYRNWAVGQHVWSAVWFGLAVIQLLWGCWEIKLKLKLKRRKK